VGKGIKKLIDKFPNEIIYPVYWKPTSNKGRSEIKKSFNKQSYKFKKGKNPELIYPAGNKFITETSTKVDKLEGNKFLGSLIPELNNKGIGTTSKEGYFIQLEKYGNKQQMMKFIKFTSQDRTEQEIKDYIINNPIK